MRINLLLIPSLIFALNFEESIDFLLKKNFKLKAINYNIKAKYELKKKSIYQYYPSFNINGYIGKDFYKYKYTSGDKKYNTFTKSYSFTITQNILNLPIFAQIKDSNLQIKYAKLQKKAYTQQLLNQFLNLWIDAIYYKNLFYLYKQKLILLNKLKNLIQTKLNLNAASKTETLYIQNQILTTQKNLVNSQYNFKLARSNINLYIDKNISITYNNFLVKKDLLTNADVNNNVNLQLYKLQEKITFNNIIASKYKLYPTLKLKASYSDTKTSDSLTKRYNKEIGIEFNIPFSFSSYKDIDIQKQKYLSSKQETLDYKQSLINEKNNLFFRNSAILIELEKLNNILKNQKEIIKNIKIAMSFNKETINDIIKQQLTLIDTHLEIEKLKYQFIQNYVKMLFLTGELSPKEAKKIKNLFKE